MDMVVNIEKECKSQNSIGPKPTNNKEINIKINIISQKREKKNGK